MGMKENEIVRSTLDEKVIQALDEMKSEARDSFCLEKVNLAELGRRTGLSRAKLRRLKENGFVRKPHGLVGRKSQNTVLAKYTHTLDSFLSQGVKNAVVCLERLQHEGYTGGLTTIKQYIKTHKHLLPAKRQAVSPQGPRARRYSTGPGEAFQMDWGFTNAVLPDGHDTEFRVACFAMICHHCGERYVEFFPNARQENLFIGMVHGFLYMGIPKYVLTDNMKSVVIRRDSEGYPVWQSDYETFMRTVNFQTKLCKPRHPFTKGKVERLIRFVKENFLVGRSFWNITDLNRQSLTWCNRQNTVYHKAIDGVPHQNHLTSCASKLSVLQDSQTIRKYLCPPREISFDGFVSYESRRFGIPSGYKPHTARVSRYQDKLYIYSEDLTQLLAVHPVTWSMKDSYCRGQFADTEQPEEFPTVPVTSQFMALNPQQHNDDPSAENSIW